jgi:hypothetical protein
MVGSELMSRYLRPDTERRQDAGVLFLRCVDTLREPPAGIQAQESLESTSGEDGGGRGAVMNVMALDPKDTHPSLLVVSKACFDSEGCWGC